MKHFIFYIVFQSVIFTAYSQGVKISDAAGNPDASSMLEIESDDRGFLPPRMTTAERDAIPNPAIGLVIFNTDCNALNLFLNSGWETVLSTGGNMAGDAGVISGNSSVCQGQNNINFSVAPVSGADTYSWQYSGTGFSILSGNNTNTISAGFSPTASSGVLTVQASNACGSGDVSAAFSISVNPSAVAPVAADGSNAQLNSFSANWEGVSGALSYVLDVSTSADFSSYVSGFNALNVGNVLTYSVTGLTCAQIYYYRVRAVNGCGAGTSSNTITVSTTACTFYGCLTYGGASDDNANSVIASSDGGFVIVGNTTSFGAGGNEVHVVKLSATGTLIWSTVIGGASSDQGLQVVETSDGGFAIAGSTNSFGAGGYDFYVVKLSSSGGLLWTKTIGGSTTEQAHALVETADNGLAIAGYSYSFGAGNADFYIVKLTSSGSLSWTRTVGGTADDIANAITETSDGGLVAVGRTLSFGAGNQEGYIIKLNSSGVLQWTRTIGGSGFDVMYEIGENTDGSLVASGYTGSFGQGGMDAYIVKLSSAGAVTWTRTVGGSSDEYISGAAITSDGGCVVVGYTQSFGAVNSDIYVVKLNSSGAVDWTKLVGGSGSDNSQSVIQTAGGDYVIAGYTGTDSYVVKLGTTGSGCCVTGSGGVSSTGGTSGSGGTSSSGGTAGSGGSAVTGGTLSVQCSG